MTPGLVLFVAGIVACLALMAWFAEHAPTGYEDETGWHEGTPDDDES